jgi:putative NADH-flavin reductase
MTCKFRAGLAALAALLIAAPVLAAPAKRVVLIGATAKSAPAFFKEAFARGYDAVGVARRPEAVEIKDPHLTVVKGDVLDEKSIEAALSGNEVVVSYLSCCRTPGSDPHAEIPADVNLLSKGISNVIQAMRAKGNRRLIAVSSTSVEHVLVDKPGDDAAPIDQQWWRGRYKFDDQRRMEAIVFSSGLDFIIVRPARVTGDESSGKPINTIVNKASYDPMNRKLSRPDLAAFIMGQMESTQYLGDVVGVWN